MLNKTTSSVKEYVEVDLEQYQKPGTKIKLTQEEMKVSLLMNVVTLIILKLDCS